MMIRTLLLAAALAMPVVPVFAQSGDPVVMSSDGDMGMNAASAAALKTLPLFHAALADPAFGATGYALKVAMRISADSHEHIWVDTIVLNADGTYDGRLANEPNWLDMHQGDAVSFDASLISDWSYWKGDKLHGNYTTRVMLPHLSKDEAAQIEALLAPLPKASQ